MQKLREYWMARSRQQRLSLVGAFAATFLLILGFALLAGRTPLALLYGGLPGAEAGAIVAEIERRGVAYEVRGDAIWVSAAERDRLRMDLAAQGLPSAGGAGYELLDGMSGFGTTSQMFDAAYWRAKEGELARTILAMPGVRSARVHIAVPNARGYRREGAGSASVTLTAAGDISREQARSVQLLVASGVPGLGPDAVSVIDSLRGVLTEDSQARAAGEREAEMKRNVERILEPHVGRGNAIVELALELDTGSEQTTEQRFDPRERALISQEVEETTDESQNQSPAAGGPVTAASNLPDGAGRGGEQSRASRAETRQRSNYEVSQVTREVTRQPGAVKRLTIAVLVNGVPQKDAKGDAVVVPRGEAELTAIRELVASAVGFDEARGDLLTVKSLPFADVAAAGTLAERPGALERLALNELARIGLIGLFALGVAALVLRPALRGRSLSGAGAALPAPPSALAGPAASAPDMTLAPAGLLAEAPQGFPMLGMATPDFAFDPAAGPTPVDSAVERLKALMRERHEESVRVLAHWVEGRGEAPQ